jgi:hypothetical protein
VSRSIKLIVAVLTVILALSLTQNAFAVTELSYDDGIWNGVGGSGWSLSGVRFSLPGGVSSAKLTFIRWGQAGGGELSTLVIHVTLADHVTELPGSPISLSAWGSPTTGCPALWLNCYGLDVTSYNFIVTGDFFVIYAIDSSSTSAVKKDAADSGHSFFGDTLADLTHPDSYGDYLIRVDIEPIAPKVQAPVGGVVEPVNTLAIAAPYLALFGVIAAVAVVVWKKREN